MQLCGSPPPPPGENPFETYLHCEGVLPGPRFEWPSAYPRTEDPQLLGGGKVLGH